MSLSQVQIIRSLAEALAWFEKEIVWTVNPAELRHLTGRIGELYAAMITRGQMALSVNQNGYDVVSAEGERISVKTITSSLHISFNKSTLSEFDRVMILRINIDETEASIEEIFDGSKDEIINRCTDLGTRFRYMINQRSVIKSLPSQMKIVAQAAYKSHTVEQYENGTISTITSGKRDQIVKPILRNIASDMGLNPLNSQGNPMNTRQLGSAIITTLNARLL